MPDSPAIRSAVANLYNTYPFPPDPLSNEPPPGYNWRWNWLAAYSFCTGQKPEREEIRILDAGCGTGVGTEYLIHLNTQAEIVAIDISKKALALAKERAYRSGVALDRSRSVQFHQLNLEAAATLPGQFDFINCVGVLHHLPDPTVGIQALASKLAPGGIMHVFVYGELGRWEIRLMQQAIALLQGSNRGDYRDGVRIGRQLFASLPENNRLRKRETDRWSLDNRKDETFADMYVHPQEIDYTIASLFELIEASKLEFLGFSNPQYWRLERLMSHPELIERTKQLSPRDRYRLIELLDPEGATHYEFFLGKSPLPQADWREDDVLLAAVPTRHPCLEGWPSQTLFGSDYQIIQLSAAEFSFVQACDANAASQQTVGQIIAEISLPLDKVRSLQQQQLILLAPGC